MMLQSRKEFPAYLNQMGLTNTAIEVGCWRGDHARHILQHWQGRKLTLVDPYQAPGPVTEWGKVMKQSDFDEAYAAVQELVAEYPKRCELLRMTSMEAAEMLADNGRYDFIYIDGSHRYQDVAHDLKAWWPLVKPGGVFAGHDYINAYGKPGTGAPVPITGAVDPEQLHELDFAVQYAVNEFCSRHQMIDRLNVTLEEKKDYRSWWIHKDDEQ
jgi:hypothetical protein